MKTKSRIEPTREGRGAGTEERAEGGSRTPMKTIAHEDQKDIGSKRKKRKEEAATMRQPKVAISGRISRVEAIRDANRIKLTIQPLAEITTEGLKYTKDEI